MGVKFLEVADFHYNPNRKEECIRAFSKIIEQAEKVDFIVFCGDLFDLPVYANDDLNVLTGMMKELLRKVPVCGVCGTPGHETRSMYQALIDLGFILLESGAEYGFINKQIKKTDWMLEPECLIYGLDEVNKKQIMSCHSELKGAEVNAFINDSLRKVITEKLGSMRSRLADVPAVLVVHGNISDAVDSLAEKNEALKRADIVIKTTWIEEADITYTAAGHIHQYINFEKIKGGYSGSPAWNWNSTGFLPCFNQVIINNNDDVKVERIPYGTPERRKIFEPLKKYESNIAYWLEYDGDLSLNPALNGAHEWSRMTLPESEKIERRVNIEKLENKTLSEIAEIFDPKITDAQKLKINEAETAGIKSDRLSKSIKIEKVEVENCVLFGGKKLNIELNNITGLVQITGENGSGKSSVLSFCTPYPCLIGKDTESGRTSAIKDFFIEESGRIYKQIDVNGDKHEHIILLNKGKCECFVNIKGIAQLERTSFDEMLNFCEKEYGCMADYIITNFYVQPLQGKTESGLMTANQTTVRDIVQNIAGINREAEKQYCLNKVKELEGDVNETKIKIDTLQGEVIDDCDIEQIEKEVEEAKKKAELAQDVFMRKEIERQKMDALKKEKTDLQLEAVTLLNKIKNIKVYTPEQIKISHDAEEQLKNYKEAENKKQVILLQVNNIKAEHDRQVEKVKMLEKERDLINTPCPNCGYICEDVKNKIDSINAQIKQIDISEPDLSSLRVEYAELNKIKKPDESVILHDIDENAQNEKIMLEGQLKVINEKESKIIITEIDTSAELSDKQKSEMDLKFKEAQLSAAAENKKRIEKIKDLKAQVEKNAAELEDWKYCAEILKPNKIPAMELESILDVIDRSATQKLKGYRNARYIVMTETQKEGKKSVVDKFDIKILDTQTGAIKSFKNFSVGEKSFILSAYNNALLEIRQGKNNIDYEPVISDEQDAFIDKDNRAEFYKMNENKNMLLVSHSPDIENFIFNKIKMSDILK